MKPSNRSIDLIIKPTDACNFACTFCSSPHLVDDKKKRLHLDTIFKFLKKYPNTNTIIVNGGDPLMMPVSYYWELIDYIEENGLRSNISMTTNLWDFYINDGNPTKPDKWTKLFNHPLVDITTSFNYGDGRRIRKDKVFTEEDFLKISDLMLEKIGYRPHFISVIEDSNIHTAIENVRLAKYLDVDCKLNYANASGHLGEPLELSKIYEVYLQIWREGLAEWEWNTRQMANRLTVMPTTCPLNRKCDHGIRVLHPDNSYYSCGAMADDGDSKIDFKSEVEGDKFYTPLSSNPELSFLKEECLSCPMFDICNGCYKHIKDLKKSGKVESHCVKMKSIASEIFSINFHEDHDVKVFNNQHTPKNDVKELEIEGI